MRDSPDVRDTYDQLALLDNGAGRKVLTPNNNAKLALLELIWG